ncbi:hypothetical protein SCB71_17185 [Herbiconiux sp. KACC 21604]|uniref:hypothetical protein n=1 Tax=unclassified Herbiconiux TaxID=2618217 RepID=UPI0014931750|nr:hypothetical protein [Herbiconiux sp. SALV-R1]QJU54818.1 hypothetical protein HL652_15140 [Herbiconiux sp. SALV-R1]WPO85934.1 hypothetical protein SCB71_17185 [Herbiconiux sp. KACC 21604]
MPTKSPRTNITHTPQVQHALDVARTHWPREKRESALILNLLEAGAKAIEDSDEFAAERRVARLREVAGKHTGLYEPGYLDGVREGWPE